MDPVHTPSRQQCWEEFWDVMTDVLADLYRGGQMAPEAVPSAA